MIELYLPRSKKHLQHLTRTQSQNNKKIQTFKVEGEGKVENITKKWKQRKNKCTEKHSISSIKARLWIHFWAWQLKQLENDDIHIPPRIYEGPSVTKMSKKFCGSSGKTLRDIEDTTLYNTWQRIWCWVFTPLFLIETPNVDSVGLKLITI